jgi:hypothetical protein
VNQPLGLGEVFNRKGEPLKLIAGSGDQSSFDPAQSRAINAGPQGNQIGGNLRRNSLCSNRGSTNKHRLNASNNNDGSGDFVFK